MSGEPAPLATARLAGELRASLAEAPAGGDDFALLAAYVDGELSAVEAEGVEAWLAADPEAAATAAALAALRRELAAERLPAPLPLPSRRFGSWAGLAAAAALVAAFGLSWLAGRAAPPVPVAPMAEVPAAAVPEAAVQPPAQVQAEVRVADAALPVPGDRLPAPAPAPATPSATSGGGPVVSMADFEDGAAGWITPPVVLDFESGHLPSSSAS